MAGAAAGGAAAALLAACGGGEGGGTQFIKGDDARQPGKVWYGADNWRLEDETKAAVRGGVFRDVATSDLPANMDTNDLATSQVPFSDYTHEFLMAGPDRPGLDPASIEATIATPVLADGWEFSDDGLTVTFSMRQGVKWHNIAPVNGRVMDMDDWKEQDARFRQTSQYRVGMPANVDSATFPDARHMVWHLKTPLAGIGTLIYGPKWTWMLQPKEQHRDLTLAQTKVIGTGYKVMDSYQPSIGFEYSANKDYWAGAPFIDRWREPIIPEYVNRYAQFTTGEIINFTPNARDVVNLAKDAPGAVIYAAPIDPYHLDCHWFGLTNAKTAAWKDPRVRIAIRQSIEWDAIADVDSARQALAAAGIDIQVQTTTHVPPMPGVWLDPKKGELGELSKNFLFDLAEAKKNMQAAGVQMPLSIPYHVESQTDAVMLIVDSLKRSGVFDPQVVTYPNSVAYRDCGRNLTCEGTMMSLSHDDEIDRVISRQFHSLGNIARGPQPYSDDALDAQIIAQRVELDVEKRRTLLKELQLTLARRMDAWPSRHHYNVVSFSWPWVHNTGWGQRGGANRDRWGAHLHWLDKDMPRRNG
jgi:ABC-type transport system substrate-binding protein